MASLAIAGCAGSGGGGGGDETAEISGNVIDLDGNLVQNAEVTVLDRTTRTNTGGVYMVDGLPAGVWNLQAESEPTADGVVYSAQTSVQVFEGERTRSVNLTLVRLDQQATLRGVVRDRFGNILQGVHVFAFIQSGGAQLGSVMDITNALGEYELRSLAAGYTYNVNASAQGYGSDRDTVVLSAGESRQFDFALGDPSDPLLAPPGSPFAIAWTTPSEPVSRGVGKPNAQAYEAIKQRMDPTRAQRIQRRGDNTSLGNPIEIDLLWNPPSANREYLLGYGVYRATSSGGASVPIDFLRDPETYFYADMAQELLENQTYWYEMTSLNVNYPTTGNSESNFSSRVSAETLGDLELLPVQQNPLTFNWTGTSGATTYFVYLFDEPPTIGTVEIYRNAVATPATSHVYPNTPPLVSGQRYYYMVVGLANADTSRTISRLGEFVAN